MQYVIFNIQYTKIQKYKYNIDSQQMQCRSLLRQKQQSPYQSYIPRLKITGKSNEITTSYIYHIDPASQHRENKDKYEDFNENSNSNSNGNENGSKIQQEKNKSQNIIERSQQLNRIEEREGNKSKMEGIGMEAVEEGRNIGFQSMQSMSRQNRQITQTKKKGIKQYTILVTRTPQSPTSPAPTILNTTSLKSTKLLSYFEAQLISCPSSSSSSSSPSFCMGLTSSITENLPLTPASCKSVVSMYFNLTDQNIMEVYSNGTKTEELDGDEQGGKFGFGVGDVLGVGYVAVRQQVFLTKNGKIVYKGRLSYSDLTQQKPPKVPHQLLPQTPQLHPFIILPTPLQLQLTFQNSTSNFKFNYLQYKNYLSQKLIEHDIPKEVNLNEEFTYSLVLNYFKFYGYAESSRLLEEEMVDRKMKFYPQNQPIQNRVFPKPENNVVEKGKQKRIRKRIKKGSAVRRQNQSSQPQLQPLIQVQQQQSLNSNQQQQIMERQQSQIQMQEFIQFKGSSILSKKLKTIQGVQEAEKQRQKKEQQQQQVHYVLNKKKMDRKVQENRRSQIQKIKIQRIEIMRNIESGNIDQALKIFSKFFKKLYTKQKHLQTFFKAHIFLKLFYKENLEVALEYLKKQHKTFTAYQSNLLPFYTPQNPGYTFRPLRQILFVICPQNSQKFDFQKQLAIFAQFISQIICEDAGYFGISKLEIVLAHYRAVRGFVGQGVGVGGLQVQMDEEI